MEEKALTKAETAEVAVDNTLVNDISGATNSADSTVADDAVTDVAADDIIDDDIIDDDTIIEEKNILQCVGLSKTYGKKQALKGINLNLPAGKIIGLLGPNGSGKTTLIKLINGLLTPTAGTLLVDGQRPGVYTKNIVAYLPERTYFDESMSVKAAIDFFADFYADFDKERAHAMLLDLNIDENARLKTLSKGTKEKVQLILVMSRRAKLYCLDEPIAGVDPAARDYILRTIINNYDPAASVLICTHLIADIEQVLDEVVFLQNGEIVLQKSVDEIRFEDCKSVDALFREVFKC